MDSSWVQENLQTKDEKKLRLHVCMLYIKLIHVPFVQFGGLPVYPSAHLSHFGRLVRPLGHFSIKFSSLIILIRSSLFLSLSLTHDTTALPLCLGNLKTFGWIFLILVWSHRISENVRPNTYLRAASDKLNCTLVCVKKNLSPSLSLLNWSAEKWMFYMKYDQDLVYF